MRCDEYEQLNLLYKPAQYRVWRYANPQAEPPMGMMRPYTLSIHLDQARAEEFRIRTLIEQHIERCQNCRYAVNAVLTLQSTE